jgi:D-alanine-D-alanine ligase
VKGKIIETIGITFNLKKQGAGDRWEEYDEPETIEALAQEMRKHGLEVILFEQQGKWMEELQARRPDFVFNIAEGQGSHRGREAQVPALLESLDIPHTHSDATSLSITLDKYLVYQILNNNRIPVPKTYHIRSIGDLTAIKSIFTGKERFIIKPRSEGSSKGIFLDSVVTGFTDAKERVERIMRDYDQPAIIQEFVDGEEVTAGFCGNGEFPELLGMMRIGYKTPSSKPFVYAQEVKRDWKNQVVYEDQSHINPHIAQKIKEIGLRCYKALELRDVARMDFRIDPKTGPKIVDVNPLPGLSPTYSDLPLLYRLAGHSYEELIDRILMNALGRYGFSVPTPLDLKPMIAIAAVYEETDRPDVNEIHEIKHTVSEILNASGYTTQFIDVRKEDVGSWTNLKRDLLSLTPVCVFNLFEGFSDDSFSEAQFVEQLEHTMIPFTGNSSATLLGCLDKYNMKRKLAQNHIPVPKARKIQTESQLTTFLNAKTTHKFPLFIKPQFECGSVGIDAASLVKTEDDLMRILPEKFRAFPKGVVVEEFISGPEYSVSLVGNYPYEIVGNILVDYSNLPPEALPFTSFDAKWNPDTMDYRWILANYNPPLDTALERKLYYYAKEIGRIMGCTGYFTIDFRMKESEFYALDVNPNCDLHQAWGLAKSALPKYTYHDLIVMITRNALERRYQTRVTSNSPIKATNKISRTRG